MWHCARLSKMQATLNSPCKMVPAHRNHPMFFHCTGFLRTYKSRYGEYTNQCASMASPDRWFLLPNEAFIPVGLYPDVPQQLSHFSKPREGLLPLRGFQLFTRVRDILDQLRHWLDQPCEGRGLQRIKPAVPISQGVHILANNRLK